MLINIILIILLTTITDVKSLNNTQICNPIYNCPPGYEIRSCLETGTSDICKPCNPGTVQPDYISSHTPNRNCFKPKSPCLAEDITYSRHRKDAFCDSLTGCKCNLAMCFYGDPCRCHSKGDGCPENKFLEENGECTPCPKGAAKNGTGCGPCMYQPVDVKKPVTVGVQVEDTGVIGNIEKAGLEDTGIDSTSWIPNVTSKPMVVDNCVSNKIVITLAVVLICLLLAMIIALIYKRTNYLHLCIRMRHQQRTDINDDNIDIETDEMMSYLTDEKDLTVSGSPSQNQNTIYLKNGRLA